MYISTDLAVKILRLLHIIEKMALGVQRCSSEEMMLNGHHLRYRASMVPLCKQPPAFREEDEKQALPLQ